MLFDITFFIPQLVYFLLLFNYPLMLHYGTFPINLKLFYTLTFNYFSGNELVSLYNEPVFESIFLEKMVVNSCNNQSINQSTLFRHRGHRYMDLNYTQTHYLSDNELNYINRNIKSTNNTAYQFFKMVL